MKMTKEKLDMLSKACKTISMMKLTDNNNVDTKAKTKDAINVNFDYLLAEEDKAIKDYKEAITSTNDEKALYVLSHILKEETHHVELLKDLREGKVEFKDSKSNDEEKEEKDCLEDAWIGMYNGARVEYDSGIYTITYTNGKQEKVESSKFTKLEDLYRYINKKNK